VKFTAEAQRGVAATKTDAAIGRRGDAARKFLAQKTRS